MPTFSRGERVRIMGPGGWSEKVYRVKDAKACKTGGTLYLLKSLEENPVLRLYHEGRRSLLQRIC